MPISFRLLIISFFLACPSLLKAQEAVKAALTIEGEVLKPLSLSMEDLKKMPAHSLIVKDMHGRERSFTGAKLLDILAAAGVTLGREFRGENLTKSLLMTAADGYQVVYSLAEIDADFTDQVVIVAYEEGGKELPFGEGPLRIIAPHEKKPARLIRERTGIKVLFPKD